MADCYEKQFFAPSETFGGPKPIPSCMPGEDRPADTLYEAERVTVVEEEPPVVIINLTNHQQEVFCSSLAITVDGKTVQPYGNASIIADGSLTDSVTLDDVVDLDDSIMRYIATSGAISELETRYHSSTLTPADVAAITKMPPESAGVLLKELTEVQTQLDAVAKNMAQVGLECVWYNTMQRAVCAADPDGKPAATPEQDIEAVPESIVPAGVVSSTVSLDDANAQAFAMAQASLNCFFVSPVVTVDCRDESRPGRPAKGGTEAVPNGTIGYNGRPPQKGSVVVPAGSFKSAVSVADATAAARAYGWSQLSCYYINTPVYKQCGLTSARARGVSPSNTSPEEAIPGVKTGQHVFIQEGYVVSDVSTEDATKTATDMALAALECCFINKQVTRSCDTYTYKTDDGATFEVKAKETEGYVPTVAVSAGDIVVCAEDYAAIAGETYDPASVSQNTAAQKSANDQATALADSSLSCLYCNVRVVPKCVPEWVIAGVTTGLLVGEEGNKKRVFIALPLDVENLIDPRTGKKVDTTDWAEDFTLGTPADTYCSSRFMEAQDVAEFGGSVKIRTEDGCQFANDAIVVACEAPDPYDNTAQATEPGVWHRRTKSNGDVYWFYVSKKSGTGLAASVTPAVNTVAEVAAGSFIYTSSQVPGTIPRLTTDIFGNEILNPAYNYDVNAKLTKDYANAAAKESALVMLDCYYENHETLAYCSAPAKNYSEFDLKKVQWLVGFGKSAEGLLPSSPTAANPVKIAAGTIRSYVSLREAYTNVKAMAEAMTICNYGNDRVYGTCKGTKRNLAVVPANTITGVSLEDANAKASALANAMAACVEVPKVDVDASGGIKMYCNSGAYGTCSGGGQLMNKAYVAAGSCCATTQSAADAAAQQLANSIAICMEMTSLRGPQGPPGKNGSQCSGNCYGVYA